MNRASPSKRPRESAGNTASRSRMMSSATATAAAATVACRTVAKPSSGLPLQEEEEQIEIPPQPPLPSTLVPTFYLSEADMEGSFEQTIMRIHRQCGAEFGVIKIRPPPSWQRKLDRALYARLRPGDAAAAASMGFFDEEDFEASFDRWVSGILIPKPVSEFVVQQPTSPWAFQMHIGYDYPAMSVADFGVTVDAAADHPYGPDIEQRYWNRVAAVGASKRSSFLALYGSDVQRSLFPSTFRDRWNLQALDSLLTRCGGRRVAIPGVDRPYLYFGSQFSSFSFHTEDLELFSINYHWHGEPKIWYSTAPRDFYKVRQCFGRYFPGMLHEDEEFLRHKQCMLHPGVLGAEGTLSAPVCKAVQQPGDMIITFPHGFHGGFNTGRNLAEAVNFCTVDWLPFARRARWSRVDENAVWIEETVLAKMEREVQQQQQQQQQCGALRRWQVPERRAPSCEPLWLQTSIDRQTLAVRPPPEEPFLDIV